MFRDMEPLPGRVRGAVGAVRTTGVWIRIITHRLIFNGAHEVSAADTAWWLDHHRIPYRDLCFIGDKPDVGADVYVDDSPTNILVAPRRRAGPRSVFDQPYNRDLAGPRVHHWGEVDRLRPGAARGPPAPAPAPPRRPTTRARCTRDRRRPRVRRPARTCRRAELRRLRDQVGPTDAVLRQLRQRADGGAHRRARRLLRRPDRRGVRGRRRRRVRTGLQGHPAGGRHRVGARVRPRTRRRVRVRPQGGQGPRRGRLARSATGSATATGS